MQDVTDLPFWRLISRYGGADVYFTEYFRVHGTSTLDKPIVASIVHNPTGRPIVAQMIGNDDQALVRTAEALQKLPIAAIDLNLGCPAPVVYRKCAGGGLLRDLPLVDRILGSLRDAIRIPFTVKTRIGFDTEETLDQLLPILERHSLDLVTVHGRTVLQMYRDGVRYDLIARAAEVLPCPVLANGNVSTAPVGLQIWNSTGTQGLMIGRGAVRNPWIFSQIRQLVRGEAPIVPTGRDVLEYVHALYDTVAAPGAAEFTQVQKMKKYANFLGVGVDSDGSFLHRMRRSQTRLEFFAACAESLDHNEPMALAPASG